MSKLHLKISELIALKLNGDIDEHSEKLLNDWLDESKENRQIYDGIIKEGWYNANLLDQNKYKVEEGWYKIKLKVKAKPKLIELFPNTWKYTAAAILVGVLVTNYFFSDNLFNTPVEDVVTPVIVNTNTINTGTDKAILTLEDGTQVSLEKGQSIQTKNAISNGEEIVYDINSNESFELVYNHLKVPRGGQFFIELSDGTKVWLNSESQLKYPVNFIEGQTREVELLYGEAYFDVSPSTEHKGSKFRVLNQSQQLEVIGTEFNIKAYGEDKNIYTTLVEGRVAVTANKTTKILNPSEQLKINLSNNVMTSSNVDVYNVIAWKKGVFSFRDMSLKEIMKVLSRWYDVDVIFKNESLGEITFKGRLDKKLSIEEILNIIAVTNNVNYEINNKTIIIK